jgi:fatty acid/phospholipid biosynthesis enzyme
MGGDLFPKNPVQGAIKAVNEKNIKVILVGDEPAIKKELDELRFNSQKVDIVHATQVVEWTNQLLRHSGLREIHQCGCVITFIKAVMPTV